MYEKGTNTTFLRKPAAAALAAVQEDLKKSGLSIKVFDAYRPFSVTEKFWKLVKDERYVGYSGKLKVSRVYDIFVDVDLLLLHYFDVPGSDLTLSFAF